MLTKLPKNSDDSVAVPLDSSALITPRHDAQLWVFPRCVDYIITVRRNDYGASCFDLKASRLPLGPTLLTQLCELAFNSR